MLLLRKMRLYPVINLTRAWPTMRLPRLRYPRVVMGIVFMAVLVAILSFFPPEPRSQPYLVIHPGPAHATQIAAPVNPEGDQPVSVPVTGQ